MIRSLPWATTWGSATPDLSIRLMMIWRITSRSSRLGRPSPGREHLVLDPEAATQVEAELGLEPAGLAVRLLGIGRATKSPRAQGSAMTMMKKGAARRIGAG